MVAFEYELGVLLYADDGQLYLSGSVESSEKSVSVVVEMNRRMESNRLKFNTDKNQFI